MEQEEINLINYSSFDEKYKKILITGGLGFIGSALVFRLLKRQLLKFLILINSFKKNLLSFNNQFQIMENLDINFLIMI